MRYLGIIEKYRQFLPVNSNTKIISLNEGNTPLIKADNIKDFLKVKFNIFLKYEGLNPTGSFKDRGMTMAITKAVEDGAKAVICASTGNTSASSAAYSARAGIKSVVLIPDGNIALGKLSQAMLYNAIVIAIKGNFDEALSLVKDISKRMSLVLVNSINPFRIEGQKTGAFEIVDDLGEAPDYHFMPVGNAGNITAYWKGYKEYREKGFSKKLPKMMGYEASGAAPIVLGKIVKNPETIATAIRIGNPASWDKAVKAKEESGGQIDCVTDEEILKAYKMLASLEGVFCEPASSSSLAGLIKYINSGKMIPDNSNVVCILTGNGLKDPNNAINNSPDIIKTEPNILDLETILVRKL